MNNPSPVRAQAALEIYSHQLHRLLATTRDKAHAATLYTLARSLELHREQLLCIALPHVTPLLTRPIP